MITDAFGPSILDPEAPPLHICLPPGPTTPLPPHCATHLCNPCATLLRIALFCSVIACDIACFPVIALPHTSQLDAIVVSAETRGAMMITMLMMVRPEAS